MATTTLTVTVFNGIPPLSIQVRLFKDEVLVEEFEKPNSFSKTFENLHGEYYLNIAGYNPKGEGRTDLTLTKEEIVLHPPDDSPFTSTGIEYSVDFNFTAP